MFEVFHKKYIILNADGTPVDPRGDYLVLRLDTDSAARAAAYIYAKEAQSEFPELASELLERVNVYWFSLDADRTIEEIERFAEEGDRDADD